MSHFRVKTKQKRLHSVSEADLEVLVEKLRHQVGLCCVATDRDKPRDFISFLPEPAKLVPPFALGKEGLCGAAR